MNQYANLQSLLPELLANEKRCILAKLFLLKSKVFEYVQRKMN